ncbi:adhesion G protein-coupled receptor E1-like isoform X1 [Clarias gariepinus]|uniref:adhesion G protein-coupled receptor E1-like isoform X1 n=1 Tax=Clarias gariepinus TaxID=13013 RepID=UPI00234DC225|nr:adhesion G protein-coupled receptor E1-like isoform X1 [Clarias gariepinus]
MSHLFLLFLGLLFAVLKDMGAQKTCAKGHITDNDQCVDENECESDTGLASICGVNATCYNTNGSYYCQCLTGYQTRSVNFNQDNGEQCKDINECTTNKVICGSDATCHNAPGSYYCTCVSGFVASNGQQQFTASQNVTCNGET